MDRLTPRPRLHTAGVYKEQSGGTQAVTALSEKSQRFNEPEGPAVNEWTRSSAAEHSLHTRRVTGSIPVASTNPSVPVLAYECACPKCQSSDVVSDMNADRSFGTHWCRPCGHMWQTEEEPLSDWISYGIAAVLILAALGWWFL